MLASVESHPNNTDEQHLITQARQGNKDAFKLLYLQHHPRVYAIALRLAGNESFADDITQECFVRLWHKLPRYHGGSRFSTWLHRLCVNQAINMINSQKSLWARFFNLDSMPEQMITDEYGELDQMILRLPERTRIVFVLFAIEGYRHEEIADLLNIAVGTSKTQYHRARQLLKEMLE